MFDAICLLRLYKCVSCKCRSAAMLTTATMHTRKRPTEVKYRINTLEAVHADTGSLTLL